jgi:hypothetical protein
MSTSSDCLSSVPVWPRHPAPPHFSLPPHPLPAPCACARASACALLPSPLSLTADQENLGVCVCERECVMGGSQQVREQVRRASPQDARARSASALSSSTSLSPPLTPLRLPSPSFLTASSYHRRPCAPLRKKQSTRQNHTKDTTVANQLYFQPVDRINCPA